MLTSKTLLFSTFFFLITGCAQPLDHSKHDLAGKFGLHNRLFSILYRISLAEADQIYQKRLQTQLLLSDYHNAPARENPFSLMELNFRSYHRFETHSVNSPTITNLYKNWHTSHINNSIINKYIQKSAVQSPVSNEYIINDWLNDDPFKKLYKIFFHRNLTNTFNKLYKITYDVKTIDGLMQNNIYHQFMTTYQNQSEMNLFKLSAIFIDRQLQVLSTTNIDNHAERLHLSLLYRAVYDNILFAMKAMLDLTTSPELYMWFYQFINNNIKILLIHEPFAPDSLNKFVQDLYNDDQLAAGFSTGGMDALRSFMTPLPLVNNNERIVVNTNTYFEFLSLAKNLNKDNLAIMNVYNFRHGLGTDKRTIHTLMLDMYDAYSRRSLDPLEWIQAASDNNIKIRRVAIDITHEPTIASSRLKNIVKSLRDQGIEVYLHKSGHKWDILGNDDRSLGLYIRFDNSDKIDQRARLYNPLTFQYYVLSLKASYLNPQQILTEQFQLTLNQNALRCLDVLGPSTNVPQKDVEFVFLPTDSIGIRKYFDIPFYTRNSFAFLLPSLAVFSGENNRVIFGALPEKQNLDLCRALKIFVQSKTRRDDILNNNIDNLKNTIKNHADFAQSRARTLDEKTKFLEQKRKQFIDNDPEIADVFQHILERTKIRQKNLLEMLQ